MFVYPGSLWPRVDPAFVTRAVAGAQGVFVMTEPCSVVLERPGQTFQNQLHTLKIARPTFIHYQWYEKHTIPT